MRRLDPLPSQLDLRVRGPRDPADPVWGVHHAAESIEIWRARPRPHSRARSPLKNPSVAGPTSNSAAGLPRYPPPLRSPEARRSRPCTSSSSPCEFRPVRRAIFWSALPIRCTGSPEPARTKGHTPSRGKTPCRRSRSSSGSCSLSISLSIDSSYRSSNPRCSLSPSMHCLANHDPGSSGRRPKCRAFASS